jgi:hypothetical protein
MINVSLKELDPRLAELGRGVVLISVTDDYDPTEPLTVEDTKLWDPSEPLYLAHLGLTEGDIEPGVDEDVSDLTFPEYTGPASHKRYWNGESITLTVPLYFADPNLRAICSPLGSASGGRQRQTRTREHTVVVVPEQLLAKEDGSFGTLTYDGDWEVDGQPLTDEQERYLGSSWWLWRGSWGRALPAYSHADAGKTIVPCPFSVMHRVGLPDGENLYTVGDPGDHGINILGSDS